MRVDVTFSGRRREQTSPAPRCCVVVTMQTRTLSVVTESANSTVASHDAFLILEATRREVAIAARTFPRYFITGISHHLVQHL